MILNDFTELHLQMVNIVPELARYEPGIYVAGSRRPLQINDRLIYESGDIVQMSKLRVENVYDRDVLVIPKHYIKQGMIFDRPIYPLLPSLITDAVLQLELNSRLPDIQLCITDPTNGNYDPIPEIVDYGKDIDSIIKEFIILPNNIIFTLADMVDRAVVRTIPDNLRDVYRVHTADKITIATPLGTPKEIAFDRLMQSIPQVQNQTMLRGGLS